MRAAITATGYHVPPDVFGNDYFAKRLETTDEWIRSRTGISERRFAKGGATSDMAVAAARQCLDARGITPAQVDGIIVATMTPDRPLPSTAAIVQRKLGAPNAWGFDVSAACSGFVYALITAAKLVEGGALKRALVVGADQMSSVIDPLDRATAVLFGDGAGAVLVEPIQDDSVGILDHVCLMDGAGEDALYIPSGGSLKPATAESVAAREHFVVQDGPAVFRAAVTGMTDITEALLTRTKLAGAEVDWLVPHQANRRIIEAVAKRLGFDLARIVINLDRFGNTVAATIPLGLAELNEQKRLAYGDRVVLTAFGAGFTSGAIYLRWAIRV
jgi:3-oxoacyl-[acyl-carrier-protein] synthase-3